MCCCYQPFLALVEKVILKQFLGVYFDAGFRSLSGDGKCGEEQGNSGLAHIPDRTAILLRALPAALTNQERKKAAQRDQGERHGQ